MNRKEDLGPTLKERLAALGFKKPDKSNFPIAPLNNEQKKEDPHSVRPTLEDLRKKAAEKSKSIRTAWHVGENLKNFHFPATECNVSLNPDICFKASRFFNEIFLLEKDHLILLSQMPFSRLSVHETTIYWRMHSGEIGVYTIPNEESIQLDFKLLLAEFRQNNSTEKTFLNFILRQCASDSALNFVERLTEDLKAFRLEPKISELQNLLSKNVISLVPQKSSEDGRSHRFFVYIGEEKIKRKVTTGAWERMRGEPCVDRYEDIAIEATTHIKTLEEILAFVNKPRSGAAADIFLGNPPTPDSTSEVPYFIDSAVLKFFEEGTSTDRHSDNRPRLKPVAPPPPPPPPPRPKI